MVNMKNARYEEFLSGLLNLNQPMSHNIFMSKTTMPGLKSDFFLT